MAKRIEVPETEDAKSARLKLDAAKRTKDPYEALKTQAPPRSVELPAVKLPEKGSGTGTAPDASGEYKTISQAIESNVDLTDMQYALSILLPKEDKINYGSLMIADISPEVFLPGFHMSAMDEIMMSDPRKPIDVNRIHMKHYTIWSVGLDREGRMDVADIAGASRAEKKMQATLGLKNL
jgi:hypothetical protein